MPSTSLAVNSTNVRNSLRFAWNRVKLSVAAVVAPQKAVATAARLFVTPPRYVHTPAEIEVLATGRRFEVVGSEGRLAAWRFGEARLPVVILDHGWGGRGAQLRSFVPAFVQAGYQVLLYDHAAHGLSEGRQATLVHFMRDLEAVAAHLQAEGVPLAGIVAHSLGAASVTAWLNRTQRDLRVVLIAPPTSLERYSGYFARRLGLPEAVRRAMQERFERHLGHRWAEFELPQSVEHVRAAALVIHDAHDDDVSLASGLALARAWRGAKFVRTLGLGHRRILRDPQVVADAVDFIGDRVRFGPPPRRGEASAYFAPAPIL